jgi:hypothetical protein
MSNRKSFLKNLLGLGIVATAPSSTIASSTSKDKQETLQNLKEIRDMLKNGIRASAGKRWKEYDVYNYETHLQHLKMYKTYHYVYGEKVTLPYGLVNGTDHVYPFDEEKNKLEHIKKIFTNVRWHLNRLNEDIDGIESGYIEQYDRVRSIKYIQIVCPIVIKEYLNNSKEHIEHKCNYLRSVAECYLITDEVKKAYFYCDEIKSCYAKYHTIKLDEYSNPYGWTANILERYGHSDKAYEFALLDQDNRDHTCKTKSRLLKTLSKKLNK